MTTAPEWHENGCDVVGGMTAGERYVQTLRDIGSDQRVIAAAEHALTAHAKRPAEPPHDGSHRGVNP